MSLLFGGATSDQATKTTPTGLGSLAAFTIMQWVRLTTLTSNRVLYRSGGSTAGTLLWRLSGTGGNIQITQTAAANMSYITNDTPLAATGAWKFVACTGQVGTAGHIYSGSLTALATESTYGTATVGTGPPVADAGTITATLGNNSAAATVSAQGDIAITQVYNRVLSLAEIASFQFDMWRHGTSCQGHWFPGDTGSSTVTDYSGNGNHLTITGATLSNNPPIRGPRRQEFDSLYAVIAGGGGPSVGDIDRYRREQLLLVA